MYGDVSPEQRQKERQKAKDLKKSRWWHNKTQSCPCYYCQKPLSTKTATMDHIVPISRGGRSTPGNLVACCSECNLNKRSLTPVEWDDYLRSHEC